MHNLSEPSTGYSRIPYPCNGKTNQIKTWRAFLALITKCLLAIGPTRFSKEEAYIRTLRKSLLDLYVQYIP